MARYADTLLADGERIVLRTRQHWFATIIDGRIPWLMLLAGIVLLVLSAQIGTGAVRTLLSYAILALVVVGLAWLALIYWAWYAQDYLVTNRRVLKVEGILNKRSADSSLEKINDAVLEQNLVGRMLGYGDLDILTAADTAIDRYRMLAAAPLFKRTMLDQKHLLEQEAYRIPSPPLRAAPTRGEDPGIPTTGPSAAAASAAAAGGARSMTAEEITRALSGLADLRDRGAITPEEYETKKQDLLARL
jgi:hypothetical protein